MRELYKIAVWAKDTYKDIDEAFGLKYDWETYQERKEPGSFAPKEELDEKSGESLVENLKYGRQSCEVVTRKKVRGELAHCFLSI